MYCRFCGNKLVWNSRFCDKCGNKVKEVKTVKTEMHKSLSLTKDDKTFVAALIFFVVCSTVKTTWRILLFNSLFTANMLLAMIFGTIIGVGVALVLRKCGLIKPEKLKKGVWCFSIVMLIIEISKIFEFWCVENFSRVLLGQYGVIATQLAKEYVIEAEEVGGLSTLWLWGLFVLFMLLKSESIKIKKSHSLIVLTVLIVWSVVLDLVVLKSIWGIDARIYALTKSGCRAYMLHMFLRRFILYWFVLFIGERRIGNIRSIIFAILIPLGAFLVLPFMVRCYDVRGGFWALSLGYIFGAFILLTGFIKRKKKCLREEI